MKKAIIAVLATISLSGCATIDGMQKYAGTYTVNMQQMQQEAICQSNAAVFYPECQQPQDRGTIYCKADITEESSGKIKRGVPFNIASTEKYTKQGNDRVYHEEDETGSTTVYINETTGKGSITFMDESKVTHTGNLTCRN